MDDIIHLLPDSVANQIAAGEVVQRPGSAVKELLENAIDAGATAIQLVVKDAGRTLIQVIDNGKGMSFQDARLCFERHATSKISKAEDLYSIHTKGFRGEALASIAAIAQVELKTKREEDETGTLVLIEGSEIKEHTLLAAQNGTSIAVKNLFFNVPARRNFLKSDATEFDNIMEELHRVALIHHNIAFDLFHNGKLVLQLKPSNFKQRIVAIFGQHLNDKLFPIENNTDFMKISGFLGKPENAKKRKAEQYIFLNQRFIKSSSLNFAIESTYKQLIPEGTHPAYFLNIEIDPATVDVNVSPTKVEVKLQDDRLIFGFLNAAVKKAIGEFALVPQLDFDYNTELDLNNVPERGPLKIPTVTHDPHYNPFHVKRPSNKPAQGNQEWESFLRGIKETPLETPKEAPASTLFEEETTTDLISVESYLIVNKRYLIVELNGSLTILDVLRANERIIYESFLDALRDKPIVVQQLLFPETIQLNAARAELLMEIKKELHCLGYDIEQINQLQFAVNGIPHDEECSNIQELIENLLDEFSANHMNSRSERDKNLAMSMARQKRSLMRPLNSLVEVNFFVQSLYNCLMPNITPSGKKIIEIITPEQLTKIFS